MKRNPGFTMMEIMVVLMIIGVILAGVLPNIKKWMGQSDRTKIQFQIRSVKDALMSYKMDHGNFPSSRDGLKALLENPRPNEERFRLKGHWPYIDGGQDAIMVNNVDLIYNCPPAKNKATYKYYELIYPGTSGDENDPDAQTEGV